MSRRPSEKAQRLRVRFARGPEAGTLGHLDLARVWERAFAEAGIVVSYSEGKHQQPRITLAAGLPLHVTSEGELLDVVLAERVAPTTVPARVNQHLPPGLCALAVWEVGLGLPSLPSLVRWADYEVEVVTSDAAERVADAVARFLAQEQVPWEDTRGEKVRRYDIRALVQQVRVVGREDGVVRLWMRLRCGSEGVGRPDQVVKALGLPEARRVHRLGLVVAEVSPARDAWRRRGRFME